MDLCIERWIRPNWQKIAVFEAKKANCSQTAIDQVEHQAYNACMAHLTNSGRDQMYGITIIGTTARIWYLTKDEDYLLPMVSETAGLSDRVAYIEVNSSMASELRKGFEYIVKHDMVSEKRLQRLKSISPPRPPPPPANNSYLGPTAQLTYSGQPNSAQQWPNMAVPARPAVYALPATQNPALYSTTSGSQPYTVASGQNYNDGGDEGDDGDTTMESSPGLDNEPELNHERAHLVNVTRRVKKHMIGGDEVVYCFLTRDQKLRESSKGEWESSTVMRQTTEGEYAVVPCVVYTSNKGTQYYTYELPVGKGKGKA